ncbi:hypothetical protein Vadar_008040 [Vaccinium darrowii]|uniref:Uncharacterized protein n=1 Tax=Vaccinium darrowii TaxID=229202 RepID=A0ACB7ZHU5_9ERIC|nr:hypothetical protein Vadar_008040 [Vaccinium darrowii]
MELSIQHAMASTCPYFVVGICVKRPAAIPENGAEYFLLDSTGELVKIGDSVWRSTRNLLYVADTTFVRKYSALFHLGQQFKWTKMSDFTDWAAELVEATPQFIEPHNRSANALLVPRSLHEGVAYQPSWFLHVVDDIHANMQLTIPEKFQPYILAPPAAVVIIHSGNQSWYVKIEDDKLTDGWYQVVHAHNLQRDDFLLFGYVGHLVFDLFIFDDQGCEKSYAWSTTLPIQHTGAPIGWDSEVALCDSMGSATLTACPPRSFRSARHALRCALLLTMDDLEDLCTTQRFRNYCNMQGHQELNLVMKHQQWTVNYVDGFLTGPSWKDFIHVHNLKPFDILIISPDINFVLHAMVLHMNDWENIYPWYFEDYEDL